MSGAHTGISDISTGAGGVGDVHLKSMPRGTGRVPSRSRSSGVAYWEGLSIEDWPNRACQRVPLIRRSGMVSNRWITALPDRITPIQGPTEINRLSGGALDQGCTCAVRAASDSPISLRRRGRRIRTNRYRRQNVIGTRLTVTVALAPSPSGSMRHDQSA